MENEEVISVKGLIASIDDNLKKMKGVMKSGDEEGFNQSKRSILDSVKKIEDILNSNVGKAKK